MTNWISTNSIIYPDVKVGHFSVIEDGVEIGAGSIIGNNCTIHKGTKIGTGVRIGDNCVLGKLPTPAKTSTVKVSSDMSPLVLGDECIIGTSAVIYAGSTLGKNCMVGDLASIREKTTLGDFVVVGRGVAVENGVVIGHYTKIQTGAYITAYSELGERVFIAPMVTTTNDNFMGRTEERFKSIKGAVVKRGARVGGGSVILPGIVIAEETFVAAGALVTKNTEPNTIVKGLPGKISGAVAQKELLENQ